MSMLTVSGLCVRADGKTLLSGVDFAAEAGRFLMIAGPNGAGKTTLVSAISQGAPYTGTVLFEGADVARMKPAERARRMGVLSQNHAVGYPYTVREVVSLGRYAYRFGAFSKETAGDEEQILEALAVTGLAGMERRSVLTLSGGELQRVFLAQALAQNPRLLILDEPANHLDIVYQRQIFSLLREWLKTPGRAVIAVVHDLSLALAYGDDALLLHEGRTVAHGPVRDTLSRERLQAVYGLDVYSWMRGLLENWRE